MAFEVTTISESPTAAEGEAPALPHETLSGVDRSAGKPNEVVEVGRHIGSRTLKESTRQILARGAVPEPAKVEPAATAAGQPPATETPPPEPSAGAASATTTTTSQAIVDEAAARTARIAEYNARLIAENEALKKAPRGDSGEHAKTLEELDNLWTTNPLAAYRKQMSRVMGVPEDSKDIDRHEQFLETELTSKRIGVPLTEDSDAARKAARTLVAIQRDMRVRKADETPPAITPPVDPAEKDAVEKTSIIAQHVAATKHADTYPLLHALSEDWHGIKPERLLWMAIDQGFKTGELNPNATNEALIDHVSRQLESRYQDRVAKIPAAARPSSAIAVAPPEEKKPDPPGQTVRTLTNASASVAPATPPVVKSPDKATYRDAKEKRIAIIRSHTT